MAVVCWSRTAAAVDSPLLSSDIHRQLQRLDKTDMRALQSELDSDLGGRRHKNVNKSADRGPLRESFDFV